MYISFVRSYLFIHYIIMHASTNPLKFRSHFIRWTSERALILSRSLRLSALQPIHTNRHARTSHWLDSFFHPFRERCIDNSNRYVINNFNWKNWWKRIDDRAIERQWNGWSVAFAIVSWWDCTHTRLTWLTEKTLTSNPSELTPVHLADSLYMCIFCIAIISIKWPSMRSIQKLYHAHTNYKLNAYDTTCNVISFCHSHKSV